MRGAERLLVLIAGLIDRAWRDGCQTGWRPRRTPTMCARGSKHPTWTAVSARHEPGVGERPHSPFRRAFCGTVWQANAASTYRRLGARRARRGMLHRDSRVGPSSANVPARSGARRTADSRHNLPPRRPCCPAGVGSCRSRRGRCRSGAAPSAARASRFGVRFLFIGGDAGVSELSIVTGAGAGWPPVTGTVHRTSLTALAVLDDHATGCWSRMVSVGVPLATRRGFPSEDERRCPSPRQLVPAQSWSPLDASVAMALAFNDRSRATQLDSGEAGRAMET
jgi:hypothetical protein